MAIPQFQLYLLINSDSVIGFPYIAISTDTENVFHIAEEHISTDIIHPNDRPSYDADYAPTSRYFDFDLQSLDDLVESYIGQRSYSLIVRFNEEKEITISYRTFDNNIYQEVDISLYFPSTDFADLVNSIHSPFEQVREYTFSI